MRISDWSSDVCSSDLRTFQSLHVGEAVLVRNEDFVHDDLAGDRRAQADLAVDRRRTQTLPALFEHEAANRVTAVFIELGPDHEDIRDRRVADPGLGTGQPITTGNFLDRQSTRLNPSH